ncbi:MAG: hypothetical protein GWN99_19045 [Gemmatimonadetes bacterium]|uniref:Type 4 fimbrial biogenesis protein PilX N-terminal domain-containing protein n=1 Tax=Candidatus Kutchimonas denitrificans TaxID=3056748 RepID=A0AAE4Z797_9BACT|nr:hypothetical protein [Gemmatimonadota bacterium]NIR73762.1 hypothetical protein [Candidatus Kutchimonas denitrificans]NIS03126.1 hypothetical protein [Gemmatimonadota bacterium]NIT69027.1 hypothetical protein [Gemmatimonadota bacterium]NIU54118.1 hypothetical protein [Gemmatimonadota bacterium]
MSTCETGTEAVADRREGRHPTPADDCGLALLAVVVFLAVLAAVVASGLHVSIRQSRIARATSAAAPALYAAESGLSAALAAWDAERVDGLPVGGAVMMGAGALATGDRYQTRVTRLSRFAETGEEDAGGGGYHLLASVGAVRGPGGGRRVVARLLRAPEPARWCCHAAIVSGGGVDVSGGATVSGVDHRPVSGGGDCDGRQDERAGAMIGPAGRVHVDPGSRLEGAPSVATVGPELSLLRAEAAAAFQELARSAEIVVPAGTLLDRLRPVVDGAERCDTGEATNWGEPADPGHPCFDYLPIVHARGDLLLQTGGRGQGVLLVEGDLEVRGDLEFHGLIMIQGQLSWQGARSRGAVILLRDDEARARVVGGGELGYSGCALERALRSPKLVSPHPLAQFSWLEILEEG